MHVQKVAGFDLLSHFMSTPVVTVRAIVNAGSVNEQQPECYGVAHYLEHMFFKGTEDKDYKELGKELTKLGIHNAYTNYARTVYYINCLPTPEDVRGAVALLAEMMFKPRFDPKEFEKERGVILEECQMYEDDPHSYFFANAAKNIWGDPGHPIIGFKESVGDMSIEQLTGFRDRHYDKSNIAFSIIGPLSDEVAADYFGEVLPQYDVPEGERTEWPRLEINYDKYEFSHVSKQTFLQLTMQGPTPGEEEELRYVNDVFINAYGSSSNSLLFNRLRQELGLCYAVSAYEHGFGDNNSTNIYTMLDAKNAQLAADEAIKLLKQVQDEGFDEETLAIAKKNCAFCIANRVMTPAGFASACFDRYFTHGLKPFEEVIDRLNSVTNEDIMAYARWVEQQGIKWTRMNG